MLEGDNGQSRGSKRNWDEAHLDREAENMGAIIVDRSIVDESQHSSNIGTFIPRSLSTNINSDIISSMPIQLASTYMVTPETVGFETIDGFSSGLMAFPSAMVGVNDIFYAPLLY